MTYSGVFTPEARAQLVALFRYIEIDASPAIAKRFTDAIVEHCERFRELPARSVRLVDMKSFASAAVLERDLGIAYPEPCDEFMPPLPALGDAAKKL
jgi:toxin ParE1/3/4